MKNIKSFNLFESVTSESYYKNKDLIDRIESDIEMIFMDMLDDGYDLNFRLTDYAGNISNIEISSKGNRQINFEMNPEYLDIFEHLYNYVNNSGFKFWHISANGWLCNEKNNAIQFDGKSWDFMKDRILQNVGIRGTFNKLIICFTCIHKLDKNRNYL